MKKLFYIALFIFTSLVLIGCGEEDSNYTFSMTVDNISELQKSIVFDVTLNDDNDELKDSDVKAELSLKDSKTVLSSKKVTFSKEEKEAVVKFESLTPDTEYKVIFYTGYNGSKVTLYEGVSKTSNEGTEENPYKIDSYDDFSNIMKHDKAAYYELVCDIDFEGRKVSPLFSSSTPFTGVLDGKGYTIKNLKVYNTEDDVYVSSSTQYYGFLGYIGAKGVVKNLTLKSFNVNVARSTSLSERNVSYYGLLAGYNAGTIENVHVEESTLNVKSKTTATGAIVIGGLVGNVSEKGTLTNSNVNATINIEGAVDATVGGVVGSTAKASLITQIADSKTTYVPNISEANFAGEINVTLTAGDSKDATTSIGGVLGKNFSAIVDKCSSEGTLSLKTSFTKVSNPVFNVGGLVGWNLNDNAKLTNSSSSATFDITVFEIPENAENKLTINAGLLVGRNGGTAPAHAVVVDCEYTLPEGKTNVINVMGNASVVTNAGLIGRLVNEETNENTFKSNSTFDIVVKEHKLNDEKEPVVENEILVHITAE